MRTRRVVTGACQTAGALLLAAATGCSALPVTLRPPLSQAEAIAIAAAQYDTTSNYCGFSSCPSISPRPLVVESAVLQAAARHAVSCPTEAISEDPRMQVWAIVIRFAEDPGGGQIWLVDERSGEIVCSAEFDARYRATLREE